jgi:RNA 3'-terminal phosphate cyclase (ATP)
VLFRSIAFAAECDRGAVLGADAVGKKGTRVETVVGEAVADLRAEVRAGVGVDVHQADQLPVLMALAGGGSFTCRMLSAHARTVLDLIPEFLPVRVETESLGSQTRVVLSS